MKVYNLTTKAITYRGKDIPVNGFLNYPELDKFIPDRDKDLEAKKVLAFGKLPLWWRINEETKAVALQPAQTKKEKLVSSDKRDENRSFKRTR